MRRGLLDWLAATGLVFCAFLLQGDSCAEGTATPPPPPSPQLVFPNAYTCNVVCSSPTIYNTFSPTGEFEKIVGVCIGSEFNSDLPGGPPFTPRIFASIASGDCQTRVAQAVEGFLDDSTSACDFTCSATGSPGSLPPDPGCNATCIDCNEDCAAQLGSARYETSWCPCGSIICSAPLCVSGTIGDPVPTAEELLAAPSTRFTLGSDSSATLNIPGASATTLLVGQLWLWGLPCLAGECNMAMSLNLSAPDFTLGGHAFSQLLFRSQAIFPPQSLDLLGDVPFTLYPGGVISTTGPNLSGVLSGQVDGQATWMQVTPDAPINGMLNEASLHLTLSLGFQLENGETLELNIAADASSVPPVASAGPPIVAECTSPSGAIVTLDGSASYQPSGPTPAGIIRYVWSQGSEPGGPVVGTQPTVRVQAPMGQTTYRLTVLNSSGQQGHSAVSVTVQDTTPPTISSIVASPSCLWPPDGGWEEYDLGSNLSVQVSDTCDTSPSMSITNVGAYDVSPVSATAFQFNSHHVCLQSNRFGSGDGRVYSITLGATDKAGNRSSATTVVSVPHDQRPSTRCNQRSDLVPTVPPACEDGGAE